MALTVHRSNRMEKLADALGDIVSRPLGAATIRESIVVQGRGMERWLSMRLARRFGIWANPDFPFPRRLIFRAARVLLGEEDPRSACFEPQALTWSVAALLPLLLGRKEFAPIANYLRGDDRARRRLQLAARIADTFDQYAVFRPEMVLGWDGGKGDDWQAVLWRAITERHGRVHVAARIRALLEALDRADEAPRGLPPRIAVFGVSTLPPLYLRVLVGLSRLVEVHLLLLSPSREYWADVRSKREIIRELARRGAREGVSPDADELHLHEGNPLLASLGHLGRDFQCILEEEADYADLERYEDPGHDGMLRTLQSDLLLLRHRGGGDGEVPPIALTDADRSISVHACHGPMREVEVLHDQLCEMFEKDPSLEPRDVVVMSPAIDAYAPYVDAVFGRLRGAQSGRREIPYHVADRSVRTTDEVVEAFARLIRVLRGRLAAAEVVDLLTVDPLRRRFRIEAEDLDRLRRWVGESGIRWGADAGHRGEARGFAETLNTWRFGLDRLLLGHAIEGEGRICWRGVLPFDGIEGDASELLGHFVEFCEEVFRSRRDLDRPRAVFEWTEILLWLLGRMVEETPFNRRQHQRVRAVLAELRRRAVAAGFDEPLPLDALLPQIDLELRESVPTAGFLSHGVTFCALVPMRSIPFRVVCLLGMNDGAFPRVRPSPGFDRTAARRRRGDRSQREEDRYLFLEALLSARDHLLVSYVGQDIHDNTELPPSVVVSDLLDSLDESFRIPPGRDGKARSVRERVVVRHPLQAFSPRYFGAGLPADDRLFSYATTYVAGAQKLAGARSARPPFLSQPLPPDPEASAVVTIDELARFFENPARGLLQHRLGIRLRHAGDVLDGRDPLELDELHKWEIGQDLLRRRIAGEDLESVLASVAASGRLPQGTPGRCLYREISATVETVAAVAGSLIAAPRLEPRSLDETIGDVRLTGVIRDLWPAGQVRWQYARLAGRHQIGFWIRHLALCLAAPDGSPRVTFFVARAARDEGAVYRFRPVARDSARERLRELIDLRRLGLSAPLAFFPRTSFAYVERLRRAGEPGAALEAARVQFFGDYRIPPERNDPYVSLALGDRDPLQGGFRFFAGDGEPPGFRDLAERICGPLLDHREEHET
jgi:exodeoxyribonuclease V gamma subunit